MSAKDLAEETGLAESRIRMILMNPIYNGWIRRHRRSRSETRKPAPWRGEPAGLATSSGRGSRTCAGRRPAPAGRGAPTGSTSSRASSSASADAGSGATGRSPTAATASSTRTRARTWGKRARLGDEVWEEPILAQLEGIELDDATIAAVVASLGSGPRPVTLDQARIDRQIRELALEHAAGRLEDAVYLERLHELRDARENLERTSADGISPERAVAWLRSCQRRGGRPRFPPRRPTCSTPSTTGSPSQGGEIVSVRLTPSAYAHGFALALPEKVAVARPTGVERADARNIRHPD